jgi:peptidoglycan/LPS O-acetylase OafA/YrhL
MPQVSTASTVKPTTYFRALTGCRALAAWLVFVHHGNPFNPGAPTAIKGLPRTPVVLFLHHFVEQWHVGVTIFFVLSGFLIANRYQSRIEPSWSWAGRYMQNRIARIYPLYLLLTLIFIGCWWLGFPGLNMIHMPLASQVPIKDKLLMTFLNLSFLRGFFEKFLFTGVGQGWSLTVEEFFYILAPFVLVVVRHNARRLFLFPLLLLVAGGGLVLATAHSSSYLYGFMPTIKFMLNWTIFGRASEFAIGMALALYMKRYPRLNASGFRATLLGGLWIIFCILLITVAEYEHFRTDAGLETYAGIAVNNLLLPVGVAAFFWGLIHEQSGLRHLLETKLLQELGKSSYAFYLVHFGLLGLLLFPYTTNLLVIFLVTLLVAYLLWRYVEEPIHKRLHKKV